MSCSKPASHKKRMLSEGNRLLQKSLKTTELNLSDLVKLPNSKTHEELSSNLNKGINNPTCSRAISPANDCWEWTHDDSSEKSNDAKDTDQDKFSKGSLEKKVPDSIAENKHALLEKQVKERGKHCGTEKSIEVSRITVQSCSDKKDRRERNKRYSCFICEKEILMLPRHLQRHHAYDSQVREALSKTGKEKKNLLLKLRNLGTFQHNISVLKAGRGELKVARRSSEKSPDDFLPCSYCLGFYARNDLWRHCKYSCPLKTTHDKDTECTDEKEAAKRDEKEAAKRDEKEAAKNQRNSVTSTCQSLLDGAIGNGENVCQIENTLKVNVLERMRNDSKLRIIKTDKIILNYGTAQLKRVGINRSGQVGQRMRLLARLVEEMRNALDNNQLKMSDILDSIYFDAIIEAVETLAEFRTDSRGQLSFAKPSVAIRIGQCLTKCCQLKKGMGVRSGDDQIVKETQKFMDLFTAEWSDNISCPALAALKLRNHSSPIELPNTEDLIKLKSYTDEKITVLSETLEKEASYRVWRSLAEIVLTRLIVFNKRRASEPAKLELQQYHNRPDWNEVSNKELLDSLEPIEKQLMERMDLIQVPGKRNRKVPILITPNIGRAMRLLAHTRHRCGIDEENKYFFATRSQNGYLNSWLVLHNTAVEANVGKPRLITSSRLRKYVATLAQLVDLQDGEREWLAEHLGHTLNVHKSHYRQQEPIIEMAKLSRLLVAIEAGHASQFVGKKLSDINPNEIQMFDVKVNSTNEVQSDRECDTDSDDTVVDDDGDKDEGFFRRSDIPLRTYGKTLPLKSSVVEKRQIETNEIKPAKRARVIYSDESDENPETDIIPLASSSNINVLPIATECKMETRGLKDTPDKRPQQRRTPWSKEDLDVLRKEFSENTKPPNTASIKDLMTQYASFAKRTVAQIRSRAWDLIQKGFK